MNASVFYLFINFPAFMPLSSGSFFQAHPLFPHCCWHLQSLLFRAAFCDFPFLRQVSLQVFCSQPGQQQFLMLTKFELNLPTAQGCSPKCQRNFSAFLAVYVLYIFYSTTPLLQFAFVVPPPIWGQLQLQLQHFAQPLHRLSVFRFQPGSIFS